MKTLISSVLTVVALVGGCAVQDDVEMRSAFRILATYDEASSMTVALPDEDAPLTGRWPATAIVVETASGSSGAIAPATLFLLARPDGPELTAADIVNFSRLAVPIRSPGIAGRWIAGRANECFFVIAFDSCGTAGKKVMVFKHTVVWNDPVQEHWFLQIMAEMSRLPVFLADVDDDGVQDILIASELSNVSGAEGTPKTYRVVSIATGAYRVVKEIDQSRLSDINDLSRLRE